MSLLFYFEAMTAYEDLIRRQEGDRLRTVASIATDGPSRFLAARRLAKELCGDERRRGALTDVTVTKAFTTTATTYHRLKTSATTFWNGSW